MKKEVAVFAVIFMVLYWITDMLHLPYADEIWLAAGIVAAGVAYWIRPNRKEGYLKFIGPLILVVLAGYVIVLKAPKLIWGQMNYPLGQLLSLVIYASVCWLFIKWRERFNN